MEEHNHENALQFLPPAINWMANDVSGLVGKHHASELFMIAPRCNEIQVPIQVTELMNCQQTPQNYVQFLAESGYPETLNEMPCTFSAQASGLGFVNLSQQEQYLMPHGEGTTYPNMEYQVSIKKEDWKKVYSNAFQTYTGSDATTSSRLSEDCKRKSREKAYASDRNRRLRISQWLDALQELFPHLKEGNKENLMDNVIGHMKYLQNQLKDLCRSRLGGESTSNSFMFLEGHGHYLVNQHILDKPLEEMLGKLFVVNPAAATELLNSRGLLVFPLTPVEGLHGPIEMLGMQGIMELDKLLEEAFPSGIY